MYVAKSSVEIQSLQIFSEFTPKRNHIQMSVEKPLITAQTSLDIRKFIQERNYINVICVAKSSVVIQTLQFIGGFILGRNLINVMSVARSFV